MSYCSVAIIPARGGSKGIPKKNIKLFLGLPLIQWTIDVARSANLFTRVIVTTDDREIYEISKKLGAETPFIRPHNLANDNTSTAEVVRHTVDWLKQFDNFTTDAVVVLEPTSPGRRPEHLRHAIDLLFADNVDSIASVTPVPHHYIANKQLVLTKDRCLVGIDGAHPKEMIHRRQDLPIRYCFDGNIFACRTNILFQDPPTLWGPNVKSIVVDRKYSVDLDYIEDWIPAEEKLRPLLTTST